jgi:hypothetical protein
MNASSLKFDKYFTMRFQEFKYILSEASGGMWDRMNERRSGKPIVFTKNGESLDLVDVQVFPRDPKISSYKEFEVPAVAPKQSATAPVVAPTPEPAAEPQPQQTTWKGRKPAPVNQDIEEPEELEQKTLAERKQSVETADPVHTKIMLADILAWIQSQGAQIEYAEQPKNTAAAAMVVILGGQDADGKEKKLAFVNWYPTKIANKIPPLFWKTVRFEEATGWVQGNAGKSATAKAAVLRMDPSDLLEAEQSYDISQVPTLITNGKMAARIDMPPELKSGIPDLLGDLASGPNPTPVPGLEKYEREIEVVLGETAAPIALMTGNRVSGAYNDVTEQLLQQMEPPLTWQDFTQVIYGKKGGKVEDCSMYAGEVKLMVSSKDSKGGAAASLTGFMETIEKNPTQFGPGTEFYDQYKDIFTTLELIHNNTGVQGILEASKDLKFIDDTELKFIRSIYNTGRGRMADVEVYPNLPTVLKAKGIKGTMVTNSKGQRVASGAGVDVTNPKYQLGYHLLGNLAVMIQKHFAKDQDRVTALFKSVLNRADMVQVYTKVDKNNQGLWFEDFKVTWPPTFNGKIIILADHYTANAPAGKKISFKFV